jgi:hypothetical protein
MSLRNCRLLVALFVVVISSAACSKNDDEPAGSGKQAPAAAPEKPRAPLITKNVALDWCKEHGVPESICTRCNASLIEGYKKKGDWCKEHDLPESQCFACHPELEAKFLAAAPPGVAGK